VLNCLLQKLIEVLYYICHSKFLMRISYIFFLAISIFFFSFRTTIKVDTIVYNGKVYTVNEQFDKARAFAISDGKIIDIGTNDLILKKYSAKEKIDAKGQAVFPGFIDAHAHFVGYGQSLFQVDLFGSSSWEEIIDRVKKFAAQHPNEAWIRGRGWDQNKFSGKSYPTNEKLNELFPGEPVFLSRVDGHAAIANRKALDIAGVKPGQTLIGGEVEIKKSEEKGKEGIKGGKRCPPCK
jgi:predicted amidohydrolase YtcJ